MELKGIELEIPPAKGKKGRFIEMLQSGSGSRTGQRAKPGGVKVKAKGRKGVTEIARANLCATTGAREMDTVVTLPPATSPMMVLKEEQKGKGRGNIVTRQSREESKERNHGNGDRGNEGVG